VAYCAVKDGLLQGALFPGGVKQAAGCGLTGVVIKLKQLSINLYNIG
jgi:hypothetical protein